MPIRGYDKTGKVSRRSLLAVLAAAIALPVVVATVTPESAEAQERQFTTFRHQPRVQRPRSELRGPRHHRRVARIHRRGPAQPQTHEAPAQ
jgi:hypothetical protein